MDPELAVADPAAAVAAADPSRVLEAFAAHSTGANRAFGFGPRPA